MKKSRQEKLASLFHNSRLEFLWEFLSKCFPIFNSWSSLSAEPVFGALRDEAFYVIQPILPGTLIRSNTSLNLQKRPETEEKFRLAVSLTMPRTRKECDGHSRLNSQITGFWLLCSLGEPSYERHCQGTNNGSGACS